MKITLTDGTIIKCKAIEYAGDNNMILENHIEADGVYLIPLCAVYHIQED